MIRLKKKSVYILLATGVLAIGVIYVAFFRNSSKKNPADGATIRKEINASMKKAGSFQMADVSDSSIYYYRKALSLASGTGDHSLVAKAKNGIANYYLRREEYTQAVKYLTDAMQSAELAGDRHTEGLVCNGLGLVNISLGKPDKAIEYFRKAHRLCIVTGDLPNAAGISLNIANCYVEKGDYAKAKEFYNENLATVMKVNDTSQIILAFINLSTVNRYLHQGDEALKRVNQALNILAVFPDTSLLCTALLEKGSVYNLKGDYRSAKEYYTKSLGLSKGTLARTNAMEAISRLSEMAEQENNFALALQLHKKYDLIRDSVMNDETRKSISEIQLKADVQKKSYENRLLTNKIDIQRKRNIILAVISVLVILVALLIALLIWLSNKTLKKSYKLQELQNTNLQQKIRSDELLNRLEKLKYEAELESKNRELTSVSLQLVNKNKILSEISVMSDKYHNNGVMDANTYKGLQKIVTDNLNSDKEWEHFKVMFEKVHTGFFTGLKARCPQLSENELRLCAYLRINLQNKEIARILNVSPPTVVTSRYRIRKKMGLDNKTVLEDYLRQF